MTCCRGMTSGHGMKDAVIELRRIRKGKKRRWTQGSGMTPRKQDDLVTQDDLATQEHQQIATYYY